MYVVNPSSVPQSKVAPLMPTSGNAKTLLAALLVVSFAVIPRLGATATLYVASNGTDHTACGHKPDPCRSISQALAVAHDGDRILVGPGRYSPTEEAAEPGFGCFCMIRINRQVTIESTDGAPVTVLDASGADLRAVLIEADSVSLGAPQRGFTVTGARREGVMLSGTVTDVTIVGNTATHNGANGNDAFFIQGVGHVISKNIAQQNSRAGFGVHGTDHRVTGNAASGNQLGFEVTATGTLRDNSATGNSTHGLVLNVTGQLSVERNALVGNGEIGIRGFSGTTVTENNIYANDSPGNCGLLNQSGALVSAINNFWGAPTGPGPDPADAVCDDVGSTTTAVPFATKPFKIRSVNP